MELPEKLPDPEPPTNGPPEALPISDALRAAQDHLAQPRGFDPTTGRFIKANNAAVKTGEHSLQFWNAIEPAKRELVERVNADLAVDAAAVETLRGLIDAYTEVRLFRQSMFFRLVDLGGPITTKGKARALYTAYLSALDRETKLATTLGLERRTKQIPTLSEVMAREE